jgi:multiple sugar transport system substrate-binding protein
MMKKLISALLVVFLSLYSLFGAGSRDGAPSAAGSSGDVQKIVYWTPLSGGDGDIMQSMVDLFNAEHKDIQVDMTIILTAEYYTKLQTALMSDQASDIAIIHASRIGEYAPEGLIAALDDLASQSGLNWNRYNQNRLTTTIYNGRHYAIPHDTQIIACFYNRAILENAGVITKGAELELPKGKNEFAAYLKNIKAKVPADTMVISASTSGLMPYYVWYSFFKQNGGNLMGSDGKINFNNEINREVLQYISDLVFVHKVWPQNIRSGGEIFTAGKGALNFNGGWSTSSFESNSNLLNFSILPFPQVFGKPGVWGDSHTLALPRHNKENPAKQIAAVKFADWLTDKGALWAKAGHVPIKPEILNTPEFKALKYRSIYAESANYAYDAPATSYTTGMIDVICTNLSALIAGSMSVDDVLTDTQAKISRLAGN